MSNYRKGADLERAAAKVLIGNGYLVIRSAGSKSPVDLVALKRGETVLVQCKVDGYLTPSERNELRGSAIVLQATAVAARWHKESPSSARRVAFTELISMGPAGNRPWTPDHGLEES